VATTTLTGTTGNNLLNAPGSVSTLVQGLAGNDTINLFLRNDEAAGGEGDDAIVAGIQGVLINTINAGDGDDVVLIRSAGQFNGLINLGAGADSLALSGVAVALINGGQVYGGSGSDTIRIQNSLVNTTIGAGADADLISFSGGAQTITSSLINGGQGVDTIRAVGIAASTFVSINGGQGNDILNFSGQATQFTTSQLGGGQGNDSIVLGLGEITTVAGGGGADTISFTQNYILASATIYGDAIGVTTAGTGTGGAADGADLITGTGITVGARTSIYGGGGNDTIAFNLRTAGLIDGGAGDDSIFLGSGARAAEAYGIGSILGGAGNDTISVALTGYSNAAQGTISGGAGTDLINFRMAASSAAGSAVTNSSAVAAVISGVSGDTLRVLTQIAYSAGTTNTAANWVGLAPSMIIVSAATLLGSALGNTTAGSIGVFSNGVDSIIGIKLGVQTESGAAQILVKGVDLTISTGFGVVQATSTTFRFSVAANTGGGINITFA